MIALLAGTGALPGVIAARLMADGRAPLVCALQGFPPEVPEELVTLTYRLETFGTLLRDLTAMGVTEVCLAGAIRRPAVDPAAIDAATAPLIPRLSKALAKGDDGALRIVITLLEEAGLTVCAAHDLVPDLLPDPGVATAVTPTQDQRADATLGEATVAEMGKGDSGQACVVRAGKVIAREGPDGTDAMLRGLDAPARKPMADDPFFWAVDVAADLLGEAADWLSGPDAPERDDDPGPVPQGGLLFKAPKPGQDRRADLPVIGPSTAVNAAAAGLDGIVIEAGGVIVLDVLQVIATLDAHGMFLWVRPRRGTA
jgi:DUF1009 family protein